MIFQFTKAEIRDGGLWLDVHNLPMARNFISKMQGNYDADLKQHKEKRSMDANAYFWVLCGKLAAATGVRKDEIYRDYIKNIGGNFYSVCTKDSALQAFCKSWESNGIGWVAEPFESKLNGCHNVNCYYGSSQYDKQQMSRLIDFAVQDCREVGIEVLPPYKLEAMIDQWA